LFHISLEEELGSSEESGKDWSDLEREAAEEDKERGDDRYREDYSSNKKKKSNRRQSLSPSKDRYRMINIYQRIYLPLFWDILYLDIYIYIYIYLFIFVLHQT